MQNATQLTIGKTRAVRDDDGIPHPFIGTVAGFSFYWLAFAIPFIIYGPNATFFFMLYTWPFFLALMPLSVLVGMGCGFMLGGNPWSTLATTGLSVISLYWLVFSFLTGW
ncbi:DUF3561 family protein [Brenneria corticis]|uniref:DUF3561 domain-containing protein n=1 Tax=Brenneria corticis TaxID=2173106 RepID=A0A2U1TWI8_9GAMM|nr:DUF3561 family protein [Brenneria sp. CFCC 11842]PWC13793.1 hypothetical protein DDT56_14540 [Brenneria sp. CFCC 11842]